MVSLSFFLTITRSNELYITERMFNINSLRVTITMVTLLLNIEVLYIYTNKLPNAMAILLKVAGSCFGKTLLPLIFLFTLFPFFYFCLFSSKISFSILSKTSLVHRQQQRRDEVTKRYRSTALL